MSKVIYTHAGGFLYGRPRIGYLIAPVDGYPLSAVGATPATPVDECEIILNIHVHPYNDALWSAWLQWVEDEQRVKAEHLLLLTGNVPERSEDCLTVNMRNNMTKRSTNYDVLDKLLHDDDHPRGHWLRTSDGGQEWVVDGDGETGAEIYQRNKRIHEIERILRS